MNPRILLIEDISDNAALVKKVLESQGCDVVWTNSAEAGLKLACEEPPALILLDLGLPDMDGQTLVGYLRREAALNEVPIIVVTAWPEETARRMTEAYHCSDYLTKPLNIRRFIEVVNSYVGQS